MQNSVPVRNAQNDAIETTIGVSPVLQILTGTIPANCAAADPGTVLAQMTLPADWLSASASGVISKTGGVWQDLLANASGTAAHFRIYESSVTTCHQQGTCTITGGGGDMTLDNTNIAINQPVTVTAYALTAGNA